MPARFWFALLATSLSVGCFSDSGTGTSNNDNSATNSSTNSSTNASTNASTNNATTNAATNNGTPGCVPEAEVCDGVDNDCDDEVDEDFADLGTSCTVGLGECEATGTFVCNSDGDAVECDASEGTPGDELCGDDLDNDCDGDVDEGFETVGDSCSVGEGECEATGSIVCTSNMLDTECDATATQPPEPNEQTCDALDNDCDGETDEGCDDDNDGYCDEQFTVTEDATCANGGGDCRDDVADAYPGGPPMCDDIDNDCNGTADDIRRVTGSEYTFDLDVAAGTGATSPILVAAVPDGFCLGATGEAGSLPTRHYAYVDTNNSTFNESGASASAGDFIADLVTDGTNCYAAYYRDDGDTSWDASVARWGSNASETRLNVLTDGLTALSGSWNLALAVVGNQLAFGYQPTSGTSTEYYALPTTFTGATNVGTPNTAGLTGEFPEFGLNPGTPDLIWLSNFININAYEVTLGQDRVARDQLDISGAGSFEEMTIETVGNTTFLALHDTSADAFEVRTITLNVAYGTTTGTTPTYGVSTAQEYVNRELFSQAPDGLTAFAEPVSDTIYVFAPTSLTFTEVVDSSGGQLLGLRYAGADVMQAIWMLDAGVPDTADKASFEVADYTCY